MDEATLRGHLAYGERRDVEIKGPGSIDDPGFLAHVARAALALSNHRDGGVIIIGAVPRTAPSFDLAPLDDAQLAGWRNRDVVADKIGPYGAPQIISDIEEVPGALKCAVLRVHQFVETPVICTKQQAFGTDLKLWRGVLYCRPAGGKPRSVPPEDPEQLRDVLTLAIQVGINKFIEQAYKSGALRPPAAAAPSPSDEEKFKAQRGDL